MSGLWLHLRNSPILPTVPVLVGFDLAVLFLRNRHWIGVWPQTGAAAQVPAYLLGVMVAGAAAWAASAPARHGLTEQLQPARVHPLLPQAHRLGATTIVLLVPYLAGQAVAFAVTAWTFPPGVHLWWGYVLLGMFVMLLAIAVGWACGTLLSPVFAAVSAAVGFLLLLAVLERWQGFVVANGWPELAVDPVSLAWRLAAVAALLLAMLWLPAPDTSQRRPRRALVLLPAVTALVVVTAATDAVVEREPPGDLATCVAGPTELCVWPEQAKYLPQLRDLQARIGLLPDVFVAPPRVNEAGLQRHWFVGPDGMVHLDERAVPPVFSIIEGSPWSYAGGISAAITASTFGFSDAAACNWGRLTGSDQRRLWAVDKWLEAYLAGQDIPDYRTDAPADMQEAWSEGFAVAGWTSRAAQFQWAREEVSDLRGRYCRPGR